MPHSRRGSLPFAVAARDAVCHIPAVWGWAGLCTSPRCAIVLEMGKAAGDWQCQAGEVLEWWSRGSNRQVYPQLFVVLAGERHGSGKKE